MPCDLDPVPTLAELPPETATLCEAYYSSGYESGYVAGWAAADADAAAIQRAASVVVKAVAQAGSYADLCDARGEPERAAAARADLRERGIEVQHG